MDILTSARFAKEKTLKIIVGIACKMIRRGYFQNALTESCDSEGLKRNSQRNARLGTSLAARQDTKNSHVSRAKYAEIKNLKRTMMIIVGL